MSGGRRFDPDNLHSVKNKSSRPHIVKQIKTPSSHTLEGGEFQARIILLSKMKR